MVHASTAGVLAALTLLASGCAVLRSGEGAEAVSAENLQKDIANRLTEAGQPPKSVTCQGGLGDLPGATTRCDVVLTDTNSIQPVVTLTAANPLTYTVTPAVSAGQLATAVGALLKSSGVDCKTGLEGTSGAAAQCDVAADGVTMTRTVEVTGVQGLLMSYAVLPVLGKQQLDGLLADRLAAETGQRPERADCTGDLQGKVGATVDCAVVRGGNAEQLTLTVAKVDGDVIDFGYGPKA